LKNIGIGFTGALKFVAILWIVFIVNLFSPFDLRVLGVHPREIIGLMGIIFSPFLHEDITHLISNSIPLLVLLTISNAFGREITRRAVVFIIIASGIGIWFFGGPGSHIGASGLVFGLTGFLMFLGFYRRSPAAIIVSCVIFVVFVMYYFVNLIPQEGVSWSGHFFGLIAGIIAAKQNGRESA
jgi:membrane associated rhomboid family serine protease